MNKLVILNEKYKNSETGENVEALTIIIDGSVKKVFDKIKAERDYSNYSEILKDALFKGIESIIKD